MEKQQQTNKQINKVTVINLINFSAFLQKRNGPVI